MTTTHQHFVTVETRLDDEGTPDECRTVESVRFVCTAPPEAECRMYPDRCGCESFEWSDDGTEDMEGHKRTPGLPCWLAAWFDNNAACYEGEDADDMRDDCAPAVDRNGPITHQYLQDEYVAWEWATEPKEAR